jgi:hypothetical protein
MNVLHVLSRPVPRAMPPRGARLTRRAGPAWVPRAALAWVALLAVQPMPAAAQQPASPTPSTFQRPGAGAAAENTGPNAAIVRRASGTYRYETIAERRVRGEERFQLLVHPDGSRTMLMWHDLAARNAQFTVVLRNEATFRPLEAFVSYWNGGRFKGSAHFLVQGAQLQAQASGPAGLVPRTTAVPAVFSIGTHPVAGDGWHTASYDEARGGEQSAMLYSLEAGTDPMKPVLGTLVPLKVERIGAETVEVPAGRFEATRWRVAGVNDLWVVGPDRLVVKSVIPARDLQYLLVEADGVAVAPAPAPAPPPRP